MVDVKMIIGTWLLLARGSDSAEDKQILLDRYGKNPEGLLIISDDGWLNAALCWGGRPILAGNPPWHTDAPDNDRLAAFDTYISYGGRWSIKGNTLTTKVEIALNPGWVGGEQVRTIEMAENGVLKLHLSRVWPDNKTVNSWVSWRRA